MSVRKKKYYSTIILTAVYFKQQDSDARKVISDQMWEYGNFTNVI